METNPTATRAVALQLDNATLERIEALQVRLNGPTRGALLRHLVNEGIKATEEKVSAVQRLERSGSYG